jgi:hypothetical protein
MVEDVDSSDDKSLADSFTEQSQECSTKDSIQAFGDAAVFKQQGHFASPVPMLSSRAYVYGARMNLTPALNEARNDPGSSSKLSGIAVAKPNRFPLAYCVNIDDTSTNDQARIPRLAATSSPCPSSAQYLFSKPNHHLSDLATNPLSAPDSNSDRLFFNTRLKGVDKLVSLEAIATSNASENNSVSTGETAVIEIDNFSSTAASEGVEKQLDDGGIRDAIDEQIDGADINAISHPPDINRSKHNFQIESGDANIDQVVGNCSDSDTTTISDNATEYGASPSAAKKRRRVDQVGLLISHRY